MRAMRWGTLAAGLLLAASGGLSAQEAQEAEEERRPADQKLDPKDVVESYAARLQSSVAVGFAKDPRATLDWKRQRNGDRILELSIRDLPVEDPGRSAEGEIDLVIAGNLITTVKVRHERARLKLESARGHPVPAIEAGDVVELRWRGQALMRGTLRKK